MEDDQNDSHRDSASVTPNARPRNADVWARAAALARRDLQRAQARALALKPGHPQRKTKTS